jgi:hypothetical protein
MEYRCPRPLIISEHHPCILPFKTDAFDCQYIPFWTVYHSSTSEYRPEFSVVSYAPIVDAKPTDIATVYTQSSQSFPIDAINHAKV